MARYTLEQLWTRIIEHDQWRRNYSDSPQKQITQVVPFIGTKSLLITLSSLGVTQKTRHLSNILFTDLEIKLENENDELNPKPNTHFRIQYQNKYYWVQKINLKTNKVMVRCSCHDYYFLLGHSNYINQCQFGGRVKTYVRKTKHYPPRNKDTKKYFGICKHLASLTKLLASSDFTV